MKYNRSVASITMKRIQRAMETHKSAFGRIPTRIIMSTDSWSLMVAEHPEIEMSGEASIVIDGSPPIALTRHQQMGPASILTMTNSKRHLSDMFSNAQDAVMVDQ